MAWTQPVCDDCFTKEHPGQQPHRLRYEYREVELCCLCGKLHMSGIYIRRDPATVPYPATRDLED